jgi:hypothetical protein
MQEEIMEGKRTDMLQSRKTGEFKSKVKFYFLKRLTN